MKTVEQILDEWAKSTAMEMDDFFRNDRGRENYETENYSKWKHVPGCYRVVTDSNPNDATESLWVGQASRLYRVNAHYYFREAWVQMIEVVDESVDERRYSSHKEQLHFREKVEKLGGKRFRPTYGPQHGGLLLPHGGWRWRRPS